MVLAASGSPVLTLSRTLPRVLRGHRFSVLEQTSHVILQGRKLERGNMRDMGPNVSQWHRSLRPGPSWFWLPCALWTSTHSSDGPSVPCYLGRWPWNQSGFPSLEPKLTLYGNKNSSGPSPTSPSPTSPLVTRTSLPLRALPPQTFLPQVSLMCVPLRAPGSLRVGGGSPPQR